MEVGKFPSQSNLPNRPFHWLCLLAVFGRHQVVQEAEVRYSYSGVEEMELDEEATRMEFEFVLGLVLEWLKD
ncbi:hypothetical protein Drorol1_Dr00021562 [Drosera rotundifolia]